MLERLGESFVETVPNGFWENSVKVIKNSVAITGVFFSSVLLIDSINYRGQFSNWNHRTLFCGEVFIPTTIKWFSYLQVASSPETLHVVCEKLRTYSSYSKAAMQSLCQEGCLERDFLFELQERFIIPLVALTAISYATLQCVEGSMKNWREKTTLIL
jgi:hypothetical protein